MAVITSLDPDLLNLHSALTRLAKVYQFRDKDKSTCHGVTVTQCYALEMIVERSPLTVGALAEELKLNKSSASRAADTLIERGLVRRTANPDSGRSILLFPTRAGKKLHAEIKRDLLETEALILAAYPREMWQATSAILVQLAEAADARSNGCS